MGALLALIPGKDWLYGALVVGGAILCWHFYDKYESAVNYASTVKAESAVTLANANQQIKDLTTNYAASLKANKVIYENELASAASQHNSDVASLRSAAAARATDPVLSGASGLAAAIAAWSSSLSRVEGISERFNNAVLADDAEVERCWRDRDSLTGK